MPTTPRIVERAEQPYVAVRGVVTMRTFSAIADRLPGVFAWLGERGLEWDVAETDRGQRWGCRLEILKTSPAEQPDVSKWETELAFRLAGEPGGEVEGVPGS